MAVEIDTHLEGMEQPSVDNSERYKNWLNERKHYRNRTVSKYYRALEKAGEWLDIRLQKPIMSVSDPIEFDRLDSRIRNMPSFPIVSLEHGHGDLSASLTHYREFLEEMPRTFVSETEGDEYRIDETHGAEAIDDAITTRERLQKIKQFIVAKGFRYDGNLIENFYLCLKSKPFVILAGTSGTGKTRLVELFAEAIEAEYLLVPVRPDWSDSSDLFGHVDLNGHFMEGRILGFIKNACDNPQTPYFICLDEMNLARVEYYLSDFLSIIETRNMKEGKIISSPLVDCSLFGKDEAARREYGEIRYPENLYVVGTVNMDETTFPFSKKVLDRANTIEFSYVDLDFDFTESEETPKSVPTANDFLRSEFLILKDCENRAEEVRPVCLELQHINEILKKANAHVGYRVRDEIVFYILNNNQNGQSVLSANEAEDNCILQKILPRIQGSSVAVNDMLCELFKECAEDYSGQSGELVSDKMNKVLQDASIAVKYPKSAAKIQMMVRRYEDDNFTSYWV